MLVSYDARRRCLPSRHRSASSTPAGRARTVAQILHGPSGEAEREVAHIHLREPQVATPLQQKREFWLVETIRPGRAGRHHGKAVARREPVVSQVDWWCDGNQADLCNTIAEEGSAVPS